jgi:recombinational DNA repair protein RecR
MKRGIFYNSKKAKCSIWESGKMCYNALKSDKFTLTYSEDQFLDNSYDFAIFNQRVLVNNWMTEEMIREFNKPTFCIVTEVGFGKDVIEKIPKFFGHYIVLDPTITETENIHSFGRPLENCDHLITTYIEKDIPEIFSFGFATHGKEWHKIVEQVQKEFDICNIHFNIPRGDYTYDHDQLINQIINTSFSVIYKPGIQLKITHDHYTKEELITICSQKTLNVFFYFREHIFSEGLSAVTDQAISSGRPLLVTNDCTFRHIHKYIDCFPNIGIKDAIKNSQIGVLKMKNDWSAANFTNKFEKILETVVHKPFITNTSKPQQMQRKTLIYIHICCINNWRDVLSEMFTAIRACGLWNIASEIRCSVLGDLYNLRDVLFLDPDNKIRVVFWSDNVKLYETPIVNRIREDAMACSADEAANTDVLYIHTKGTSDHLRDKQVSENVASWRRYLQYWTVEQHEYCRKALALGWTSCGANLHVDVSTWPRHYSGNFWWARGDYLRETTECVHTFYQSPEFWLLNNVKPDTKMCALGQWSSGVNNYHFNYTADFYAGRPPRKDLYAVVGCSVPEFPDWSG